MKLKNLKKGIKDKDKTKKEEPKKQQQKQTTFDDDQEQQRDDALVELNTEPKKKTESKPNKQTKRIQSNKLEEQEIDTSKIIIEKKQQVKKPITSWVISEDQAKKLLEKDFNMKDVEEEFESLTNQQLNEELKKKKQKKQVQEKVDTSGPIRFAPLAGGSDPTAHQNTQKLVLGKGKTETISPIGFATTPTPTLNFTNTKMGQNVNLTPIEKTPQQLRQQQIQRKMQQRQQQIRKEQQQAPKIQKGGKGSWFKKGGNVQNNEKQAPKIEFKSNLNFTNSNLNFTNSNTEQINVKAKPLEKTKQELLMEKMQKADQDLKFVSKKEQEERRKKREEEKKKLEQGIQA